MTLNPLQFKWSPRDQTLPGLGPTEFPQRPQSMDEALGRLGEALQPYHGVRLSKPAPAKPQWSGMTPGQQVMGVHDLAHTHQSDPHGFVFEEHADPTPNAAGQMAMVRKTPEADQAGRSPVPARSFYFSHGGGLRDDPDVQQHWETKPVHQVASDSIVHTAQHWENETERGRKDSNPLQAVQEGRQRINKIRESLEGGEPIHEPAWLMKHNDRLYALDGHHRIVAAREAGLSHFPARIWDRDAELQQSNPGYHFGQRNAQQ